MMKKVEIEIPDGKKVECVNGILTLVDDTPKDIKERVKTFEDAVMILGNDNQAVIDYFAISRTRCANDIFAFAKLRVIAEALNEGWEPTFDKDERRYYPWFYIYTQKEYEELDDDEKKSSHVPMRSSISASAYGVSCMRSQITLGRTRARTSVRGWPSRQEGLLNIVASNL